jgi:hypothetical protein
MFYILYPIALLIYFLYHIVQLSFINDYYSIAKFTYEIDHSNKKIIYKSKNKIFIEHFSRGYFIKDEWVRDPEKPYISISFEEVFV